MIDLHNLSKYFLVELLQHLLTCISNSTATMSHVDARYVLSVGLSHFAFYLLQLFANIRVYRLHMHFKVHHI